MIRRRIITTDEEDAHTRWRYHLTWMKRPGAVKKVKRRTNRRERREGKSEIRNDLEESE